MTPNACCSLTRLVCVKTPDLREPPPPQVNGLIESYLRSERTIILAIVPSNQDVATVDILERAKKVCAVCVANGVYTSSSVINNR